MYLKFLDEWKALYTMIILYDLAYYFQKLSEMNCFKREHSSVTNIFVQRVFTTKQLTILSAQKLKFRAK